MSEAQTEQGGSKAGAATGPNAVDGGIKTVIQALEQRRLVADMNNVKVSCARSPTRDSGKIPRATSFVPPPNWLSCSRGFWV